jgi:hypothetical protein
MGEASPSIAKDVTEVSERRRPFPPVSFVGRIRLLLRLRCGPVKAESFVVLMRS